MPAAIRTAFDPLGHLAGLAARHGGGGALPLSPAYRSKRVGGLHAARGSAGARGRPRAAPLGDPSLGGGRWAVSMDTADRVARQGPATRTWKQAAHRKEVGS